MISLSFRQISQIVVHDDITISWTTSERKYHRLGDKPAIQNFSDGFKVLNEYMVDDKEHRSGHKPSFTSWIRGTRKIIHQEYAINGKIYLEKGPGEFESYALPKQAENMA